MLVGFVLRCSGSLAQDPQLSRSAGGRALGSLRSYIFSFGSMEDPSSLLWDAAAMSKRLSSIVNVATKCDVHHHIAGDNVQLAFWLCFGLWRGLLLYWSLPRHLRAVAAVPEGLVHNWTHHSKQDLLLSLQDRCAAAAGSVGSDGRDGNGLGSIDSNGVADVWSGSAVHILTGEGPRKLTLTAEESVQLAWERLFFLCALAADAERAGGGSSATDGVVGEVQLLRLLCQYHSAM